MLFTLWLVVVFIGALGLSGVSKTLSDLSHINERVVFYALGISYVLLTTYLSAVLGF